MNSSVTSAAVHGDVTGARSQRLTELASHLAHLDGDPGEGRPQLIAQWVDEAAQQFAQAPIQAFVPNLVEHIVRRRMADPAVG